jgi:hypothetical protein
MSELAEKLVLVPEQKDAQKAFEDQSEYDDFWHGLLEKIEPQLKKFAKARRSSEEAAKRRQIV